MADLTVLYVTGWCRSGSTILGNILNEVEGVLHAGELWYLWQNATGGGTNTSCGCGAALTDCPVWTAVDREVRGDADPRRFGAEVAADQRSLRTRHTGDVLSGRADPGRDRYAERLARTYRAVAGVTGASVIVDSGKYPAEAALLDRLPGIEPRWLHMVRDPRATAQSWSKPKAYIPTMPPWKSTAYWVGFNVASDRIRRRWPDRSMLLRYEDFIREPAPAIDRVLGLIGREAAENPVRGRTVVLGGNHTVTGNPDRLVRGETVIAEHDDGWRHSFDWRGRLASTAVALPLLGRYRYGAA